MLRSMRMCGAAAIAVLLGSMLPVQARAASWPGGFERLQVAPSATLVSPVAMAFAPDGRIFIAERRGTIQILVSDPNGTDPRVDYLEAPVPFLDIQDEVLNHWDRGLLGLALDPDFETNGWVYFAYMVETDPADPDQYQFSYTRVERVQVAAADSNLADVSTRQVLIGATWPDGITSAHYSHTTGRLLFGDDKTLLIGHGDGSHFNGTDAGGRDPEEFLPGRADPSEDIGSFRAQYLGSMSGKILRVDKETGDGLPSNPWYDPGNPASKQSRIWAMGLRNPYRMEIVRGSGSTDPTDGQPGRLYIGDVGMENWEEVDVCDGGENFGWPCYEGFGPHTGYQALTPAHSGCPPDSTGMTFPLMAWPHVGRSWDSAPLPGLVGNAATGAALHSGNNYPLAYRNLVYFCDYTRNWISGVKLDSTGTATELVPFGQNLGQPVDLRFDPVSHDLLYMSYQDNRLYRFSYTGPSGIGTDPAPPTGLSGTPEIGQVALTWDNSLELDVIGYNIYRSSDGGGTWSQLNSSPLDVNHFTDTGDTEPIVAGDVYEYAVEAIDDELPQRVSGMGTPISIAITAKAWEWYHPYPGASFTLDRFPAPFPRTIHLENPSNENFDHWTTADRAPQLRRYGVSGDFRLETHLELINYQVNKSFDVGLMVGFGQFDLYYWGIYRGTELRLERTGGSPLASIPTTLSAVDLRIVRTGTDFSFEYRSDPDSSWTVATTQSAAAVPEFAGLITKTWESAVPLDMRVDYLALDDLPPVATAQANLLSGPTPLSVDFSSSSYDPDGDLLFHDWDFGDGATSMEAAPTHVFGDVGDYQVVLKVTDGVGLVDTDTLSIVAEGNHAPVATITSPASGFEYIHPDSSIVLSGSGSDVEDSADSLSYDWSIDLLDAGSRTPAYLVPGSGATSSFVPATSGNVELDVILTVTDSGGLSDADTVRVVDASVAPAAVLDLQAALADGSSPPTTPSAPAEWINLADPLNGPHADLNAFSGTVGSGFDGSGVPGDPWRLDFDGVDDVLTVAAGALSTISSSSGAAVEMWLRTPADVQTRAYLLEWLESYSSPFAGMTLAVEGGQLRLYRDGWTDLAPVDPDTWMHLIASKDSTDYEVWVDGAAVASGSGSYLGAQNSELVVGAGTFAGAGQYSNPLHGAVAEVRVYDRPLSAANVEVLSADPEPDYANAPVLLAVQPTAVTNDLASTELSLTGRHFDPGSSVRAELAGETPLVATAVQWNSSTSVDVTLPTLDAAPGDWDLRVTHPDGQSAVLPQALAIRNPSPWVLSFDASQADGTAPPSVPGAAGPWVDLVGGAPAGLAGFEGDASSGWQGDGSLGGAWRLRFDGVDDEAFVDSLAMAPVDTAMSVDLWCAPGSDLESFQVLAQWRPSTNSGASPWSVALRDSSFVLQIDVDSNLVDLGPAIAGSFTELTLNVDADSVTCYRDGTVIASYADSLVAIDGTELRLGYGRAPNGLDFGYFAGDVAILRIGNRKLSDLEVQSAHDENQGRFAPPVAARLDLVATPVMASLGDTVAVSLHYDDQGFGFGLRAAQVQLSYDPASLRLLSWDLGDWFTTTSTTGFVSADTTSAGSVGIDVAVLGQSSNLQGMGELARVRFAVRDSAVEGISSLGLALSSVLDGQDPPEPIPSLAYGTQTTLDFSPPGAASALAASSAAGQVDLQWTAPPDADLMSTHIFLRPWSLDSGEGHPEYDDASPAPVWPQSLTEARNPGAGWTEVVVSAPSASFTAVHAARTVLSAIVITEDEAGNLSDFASAPRVRAATYPLGDVGELDDTGNWVANFDGTVDAKADVPVFSKAYATGDGGAGYLPVCDIGPTSNGTTNGVPLTDNLVDFEDLVVFSQSFGASTLSKSGASVLALGAASEGPLRVVLGQARFSEGDGSSMGSKTLQVPIDLRGNPGIVRALHAELGFDASALTFVGFEPGPVLQRESDQVLHFVRNASDGRLTLDLAALGQRAYFDGDGTVGYLHFEMSGGTESFLNWNSLDLRGVDGAELDFDSSSLVETPVVPLPNQVRLLPAAPNPFNPSTTIRFELPSSGEIRLNVYSISGRLVRNLASGTWPAGYHRVTWKGQDERGHRVSSGVYLYELVYEGHRDVRKMLLVK